MSELLVQTTSDGKFGIMMLNCFALCELIGGEEIE